MASLVPAIEGFEHTSHFDVSFDPGTNGSQPTADFTFDDFLAPAAIESYLKEEEQIVELPPDVMRLGPLSSPLSTRSDIGAFFDWSVAASKTKKDGEVVGARGTENDWVPFGNHLGLEAPRSVAITSPLLRPSHVKTEDHHVQLYPTSLPHNLQTQSNLDPIWTRPRSSVSGWNPSDGSYDMVDLHIPKLEDMPRTLLADMTMSWTNHAIPVYGAPLQAAMPPYPKVEIPREARRTVAVCSDSSLPSDPCSAGYPRSRVNTPRTHPKRSSAASQAPLLSTDAATAAYTPLYPNAILRRSAQGRPIGGVPPALARIVTSSMIKKERAKARAILDAKRAKLTSGSSLMSQQTETSTSIKQNHATGRSRDAGQSISLDSVIVDESQDAPSTPVVDLSRVREVVARRHMMHPTGVSESPIFGEHSPGLFVDDTTPANHAVVVVDVDMPSTASSEDVLQVPFEGSPSGFAYAFAPSKVNQDTAYAGETQISSMGYFWPIGKRAKMTKRRLDDENLQGCATSKRIRV